jgi:hypothetical protein
MNLASQICLPGMRPDRTAGWTVSGGKVDPPSPTSRQGGVVVSPLGPSRVPVARSLGGSTSNAQGGFEYVHHGLDLPRRSKPDPAFVSVLSKLATALLRGSFS